MRPASAAVAALLCGGCTTESGFFEPAAFYAQGAFGYDAATDAAVAYNTETGQVPPTLIISVSSEAWFETFDERDRCAVIFRHLTGDPLPRAAWTADADAWFAFDLPSTVDIESDCTDWDTSEWGDDPAAVVAAWEWGLGIGPLEEDVGTEVEDAVVASDGQTTWDDVWEPAVFGGGFRWSGAGERFEAGFAPNGYAYAIEVDATFAIAEDSIPVTDVEDGSPPTGAYTVQPWFGIDAALLAPTNL